MKIIGLMIMIVINGILEIHHGSTPQELYEIPNFKETYENE